MKRKTLIFKFELKLATKDQNNWSLKVDSSDDGWIIEDAYDNKSFDSREFIHLNSVPQSNMHNLKHQNRYKDSLLISKASQSSSTQTLKQNHFQEKSPEMLIDNGSNSSQIYNTQY